VRRYVDYNLCGLNNPKTIQEAEFPFKIIKCTNCGLVYTNPQPDRKLIKDHYQEDYYKEWIEKQMNRRIHMWERRLRDLVKYKKSGFLAVIFHFVTRKNYEEAIRVYAIKAQKNN